MLSQAKKYECGIAQPSSGIAGFNVLNKSYIRTTIRNQGVSQLDAKKIGYRMTDFRHVGPGLTMYALEKNIISRAYMLHMILLFVDLVSIYWSYTSTPRTISFLLLKKYSRIEK